MKPGYGLLLDERSDGSIGQNPLVTPCAPVASFHRAQVAAVTGEWPAKEHLKDGGVNFQIFTQCPFVCSLL